MVAVLELEQRPWSQALQSEPLERPESCLKPLERSEPLERPESCCLPALTPLGAR